VRKLTQEGLKNFQGQTLLTTKQDLESIISNQMVVNVDEIMGGKDHLNGSQSQTSTITEMRKMDSQRRI